MTGFVLTFLMRVTEEFRKLRINC